MSDWDLPPAEPTVMLSVRVPQSLRERLDAAAHKRKRSLTEVVIYLLQRALPEMEKTSK